MRKNEEEVREKDDEQKRRMMMMVKMICCILKKVDDSDLQSTHMTMSTQLVQSMGRLTGVGSTRANCQFAVGGPGRATTGVIRLSRSVFEEISCHLCESLGILTRIRPLASTMELVTFLFASLTSLASSLRRGVSWKLMYK